MSKLIEIDLSVEVPNGLINTIQDLKAMGLCNDDFIFDFIKNEYPDYHRKAFRKYNRLKKLERICNEKEI